MLKTVFRFVARTAVLAVLVYLARSALKRWIDGPEPSPAAEPWRAATEPPRAAPPAKVATASPPTPPVATDAESEPVGELPSPPTPSAAPKAAGGSTGEWVAPDENGTVPSTHPVKAKLGSKVYREPGSSGYDRCRPDRCYPSAAAAEADGFVRAKR